MESTEKKFIIWDPRDGNPVNNDNGKIESSGLIGRVGSDNVSLSTYAEYPGDKRPRDLDLYEGIKGVGFSLSGSHGTYDIYRVK